MTSRLGPLSLRRHCYRVAKGSWILAVALLGVLLVAGVSQSVNAQGLSAPTIVASPSAIDVGQSSVLTTTAPFSGGVAPYSCLWLEEAPGASFYSHLGDIFVCDITDTPTISTGTLTTAGTWHFLLRVTDSTPTPVTVNSVPATVTVSLIPTAPVISAGPGTIDSSQSSTLSTTTSFSGGTSPYTCQWLEEASAGGNFDDLGSSFSCTTSSNPTVSTGSLATTGVWSFELQVTDSASETVTSTPVAVTVNPVPVAPVVSANPGAIDIGQSATLSTTTSLSGGTPAYTCQWLEEAPGAGNFGDLGVSFTSGCTTSSKPSISTGVLLNSGTWSFELQVTDSAASPETTTSNVVTVAVSIGTPVAPVITASPTTIDSGQSSTLSTTTSFSGGTSPYTCQWLEESPGALTYGSMGSSFTCTAGSQPSVSTGALSTTGTWSFELQVTDGASETVASAPVTVTVNPILTAPTVAASPSTIDIGQSSTLTTVSGFTGGTPTYTCQWLEEAPGAGSFDDLGSSFSCTTSSQPTLSTGTLSTVGTWSFELQVTDSASETVTSTLDTVTVSLVPVAPVIGVSPGTVDSGQSSMLLTTTSFSGGTSPYTCQWLQEAPAAGSFSDLGSLFSCTSGSKPSVSTGALTTTGTWSFELQVTDSASETVTSAPVSVMVNFAPGAPVISTSPGTIEGGQSSTLTTVSGFTGGTPTYTCQWLEEAPSAGTYSLLGGSFSCDTASLPTISTNILSTLGAWSFELQVTDSASETVTSAPVTVTVNPAPSQPVISVNPGAIDTGQSSTLSTSVSFAGGTPPYTCQWLEKAPGAGHSLLGPAFSCAAGSLPSVSTGALLTTGTWTFELQVTDSAPVAVDSVPVKVTVNPALGVPTVTPSASAIDSGQSVAVTLSWSGGTSPYDITLYSSPTSSCGSGSTLLITHSGLASSPYTFNVSPALTGNAWYCATVVDGSPASETTSSAAQEVTVNGMLAPPTISESPGTITVGQSSALSTTVSFSSGTSPYACQWLGKSPSATGFSAFGGSFTAGCTTSAKPSVSTGALTTVGTWSFELQVTDGASVVVTSAPATVTVNPATSSTVVSCSPLSVPSSSTKVTCKATVTGYSPAGKLSWSQSGSGSVVFTSTTCKITAGSCSVTMKGDLAGTVTITATYPGNTDNLRSSGTAKLTITKATTVTTISCTKSTFATGATITCTASVAGAYSSHTGTITWTKVLGAGKVTFSSITCPLSAGKCSVTVTGTVAGNVTIEAAYGGDSNNLKSSGTLVLKVS